MKTLFSAFLLTISLSTLASNFEINCITSKPTSSGGVFKVSAEVLADYQLTNVIFKTNSYVSEATDLEDSFGTRDLSRGAYTTLSGFSDSSYSISLYLPAYKSSYENRELVRGQIIINDYENEIFGRSYDLECSVSKL